jgi:hypothetical protein
MPGHPGVAVQGVQQFEPGLRPADLGERYRAVERDHRVGGDTFEDLVQQVHLTPVRVLGGTGVGVSRGDRRLELVGTELRAGHRLTDQGGALGDQLAVPPFPVLFGERDQVTARRGPRGAPGVGQQHQREQPGHLPVGGQLPADHAGEADRLAREVGALQVAA